jgi:hypothetical protein
MYNLVLTNRNDYNDATLSALPFNYVHGGAAGITSSAGVVEAEGGGVGGIKLATE